MQHFLVGAIRMQFHLQYRFVPILTGSPTQWRLFMPLRLRTNVASHVADLRSSSSCLYAGYFWRAAIVPGRTWDPGV